MEQKDWWESPEYEDWANDDYSFEWNIAKIVAEAERRGREAAWEEARELCQNSSYSGVSDYDAGANIVLTEITSKIDAKINELKGV